MHYPFPYIETIDDVLPAIEGRDEFSVTDKGDYTCINYNLMKADTFPPVEIEPSRQDQESGWTKDYDFYAALRRECRGLLFENNTRKIIRRPLHKFMNINENEEHHQSNIDLSIPHRILSKLDGSMASPFILNGVLRWGSKAGITDVSLKFEEFVNQSTIDYNTFSKIMIVSGYTPIYEFCSRKQRIILDYPGDQLVLIAMRDINTGKYVDYKILKDCASTWGIPLVESYDSQTDIEKFIDDTRALEDTEGFVIAWDNGHKVKLKCDWYIRIHRAKDALSSENKILDLYFNNQLDDLLAALSKDEQEAIRDFCGQFDQWLDKTSYSILDTLDNWADLTRKEFALDVAPKLNPYLKPIYFACWTDRNKEAVKKSLYLLVNKHINVNIRYTELKASLFPQLELNYV